MDEAAVSDAKSHEEATGIEDEFVRKAKDALQRLEAAQDAAAVPAPAGDRFVQAAATVRRREVQVDVFDDAARDQVRAIRYLSGHTVFQEPLAVERYAAPLPGGVAQAPLPVAPHYAVPFPNPQPRPAPPLASIAYSARVLGGR